MLYMNREKSYKMCKVTHKLRQNFHGYSNTLKAHVMAVCESFR